MKIKKLMDKLNGDAVKGRADPGASDQRTRKTENVVYIENSRPDSSSGGVGQGNQLISGGTQWSDQNIGELLVQGGKLDYGQVQTILDYQLEKGLYFGEAAVELALVEQEDILQALSVQFGYTYTRDSGAIASDVVLAHDPFGEQAEEFRCIRSRLVSSWLTPERKVISVVSAEGGEGRSYVAANLAVAFSQQGKHALLIDGDMRTPRQHKIFNVTHKMGLSTLLSGRVNLDDLAMLPEQNFNFPHFALLPCGAVPPNPAELLSREAFELTLRQLKKFFDVIIIDTPSAMYQADIISIASVSGSALMVVKEGQTKLTEARKLTHALSQAKAEVVGAILNKF